MAAAQSLLPNLSPSLTSNPSRTAATFTTPIRCGPRGNRGPLVKGRVLSTEAIQAIQSLKRAANRCVHPLPSLSRLIKSDLLAALRELLRQDQCTLALHVLSTVRSEYPPVDLNLYAEVVSALARNGLKEEIDRLIGLMNGIDGGDDKGTVKLLKGVVGAGRRESTVRIYRMMKERGWGSDTWEADEYVVQVLSKGLRGLGERELADEVEREFGGVSRGSLGREKLRAVDRFCSL